MREIFIGDVHGCYDEWMSLLDAVGYDPGCDRLYMVGDLVNRGPKSVEVLEHLIAHPEIRCVMGNHEYFFLKGHSKGGFEQLRKQFGRKEMRYRRYMETMELYIETPRWILVHAGVLSSSVKKTPPERMLTMRYLEDGSPWFEHYHGRKLLIHGHWAQKGLYRQGKTWGLDSGCVYGGRLSALILPEQRVVSVPARRTYHQHHSRS